ADDAAFFRRINLALAGLVPVPSEVRLFLADADPHKRAKAIDKLLASPAYANHMTTTWRGWLLPEAVTDPQIAQTVPGFETWLRARIQTNVPFDRFVTELLTAPLGGRPSARPNPDDPDGTVNPLAFYTAKQGKPENLAAAASRLFLGVQIECAQCHDHPFGKWSRDQFWGMAAFFAGVEQQGGGLREVFDRRELSIPGADRTVPATFLDDKEPEWQFRKSPRVTLATWITRPDNPYFARATVNRLWGFVFGVGLVDPIDDFNDKNAPSHPELLDRLAKAFVESGYDTKFVLRAILLSETFQRSSATTHPGQKDVRLYARFPAQGLTPEQLFDSLSVVIGNGLEGPGGAYLQNPGSARRQFVETFALTGHKTESSTTIIQALLLMNGGLVGAATTVESSRTLAAVVELPGLTSEERIEALYLAALGRGPKADELKRAVEYVKTAGSGEAKGRYADVLWALLNGVEFRTNH
ncbi:MAG: DUF1553 domain-containing protein, partial [Planctomycetes bacterium]|nr:DUF1553 domain-containing protein [Planctomycetota bacterium]